MSGVQIVVDWDSAAVARYLTELAGRVDAKAMYDEMGNYMVSATQGRMRRGVKPDGSPQKPLKRRVGVPLIDSGRLRGSITHEASEDQVVIGTNVIYAAIQQFGGKAGRGHKVTIPARPYLGVSDQDEQEIGAIVRDYIEAAA